MIICLAYLAVVVGVGLYAFSKSASSSRMVFAPDTWMDALENADVAVEADLFYRNNQNQGNRIYRSNSNIHAASNPYLSWAETLELYQPPAAVQSPEHSLIIPEGCEVSTNLAYELTLFSQINAEREKRGLEALTWNQQLSDVARQHSVEMACNRFFSHVTPQGEDVAQRINEAGYDFYAAGENLYAGDDLFNTPRWTYRAWYNSARHFDVMMHKVLTEVGIGYIYAPGSQYGAYFTADFATPE